MKSSDDFKRVIKAFLDEKARNDDAFNERYMNEKKSIDECCNFVLNTVKETGCHGFTDAEVYGIAVHYYDEDKLDTKYLKDVSGVSIVTNHHVELSEEEKKEIEEKARKDYYDEQMRKQLELNKPKKRVEQKVEQMSLF